MITILLVILLLIALGALPTWPYSRSWGYYPNGGLGLVVIILLVLLLIATFLHAALGLQVVIEDYIHAELTKLSLLIVLRLACFAFAVAGIFAVLAVAVGTS